MKQFNDDLRVRQALSLLVEITREMQEIRGHNYVHITLTFNPTHDIHQTWSGYAHERVSTSERKTPDEMLEELRTLCNDPRAREAVELEKRAAALRQELQQ